MKLRIRGNSIRLRLTRGEVDRVGAGETVEEIVDLHPVPLAYSLVVREAVKIEAIFDGGSLAVVVPEHEVAEWANGDEVGMEAESGGVRILIEKDFACVQPRTGEDESDMFEHPNPSGAC
jgi:hypothetical protein